MGNYCHDAIEESRVHLANLIGASPSEIYFTSGGTESNNLVIKGIFFDPQHQEGQLITSCFEHPAIKEPARFHQSNGGNVLYLDADSHGTVDLNQLEATINSNTKLVSIMHANNEIGTIQPLKAISEICRRSAIKLHTDAAQSLGKIQTNVDELGVDFLTIAGHKLYAPKGIGALYIRNGLSLVPSIHGANHEKGVRPGTENVPYIVGLGVAAKLAKEKETESPKLMESLRDTFQQYVTDQIGSGITVNGNHTNRLPNTSSINFPNVVASQMLQTIPQLCLSTGAACHSGSVSLSDTLSAIGLTEAVGAGTVRFSCGRYSTAEEINTAATLLVTAWKECHESN